MSSRCCDAARSDAGACVADTRPATTRSDDVAAPEPGRPRPALLLHRRELSGAQRRIQGRQRAPEVSEHLHALAYLVRGARRADRAAARIRAARLRGRDRHRDRQRRAPDCARCRRMSHVFGYTCANEGSVRDWLRHSKFNVTQGKNFDRSGSIGPYLVTADEVGAAPHAHHHARQRRSAPGRHQRPHDLRDAVPDRIHLHVLHARAGRCRFSRARRAARARGFDPPRYLRAGRRRGSGDSRVGLLRNKVMDDEPRSYDAVALADARVLQVAADGAAARARGRDAAVPARRCATTASPSSSGACCARWRMPDALEVSELAESHVPSRAQPVAHPAGHGGAPAHQPQAGRGDLRRSVISLERKGLRLIATHAPFSEAVYAEIAQQLRRRSGSSSCSSCCGSSKSAAAQHPARTRRRPVAARVSRVRSS